MNIIESNLKFKSNLKERLDTKYLVFHHALKSRCTVDDVQEWHLNRGWLGFGYHFFVSKEGIIFTGRPIEKEGAHTKAYNEISLGICFEGDFTKEVMEEKQLEAGRELVKMIRDIYPDIEMKRHSDLNNRSCPGVKFPFEKLIDLRGSQDIKEEIFNESISNSVITDIDYWKDKLDEPTPLWATMAMINNAIRKLKG